MARVTNIHGQSAYIDGTATGQVFVDFGEPKDQRFVRVRVRPDDDGMIVVEIDGEMCSYSNDAPSMQIVVNGTTIIDTAGEDLPQPQELWMPR